MKNLKIIRKKRKITQQQLADKMEISQACISSWECSRTEPNIQEIIKLTKILSVDFDDLTGQSENL